MIADWPNSGLTAPGRLPPRVGLAPLARLKSLLEILRAAARPATQ